MATCSKRKWKSPMRCFYKFQRIYIIRIIRITLLYPITERGSLSVPSWPKENIPLMEKTSAYSLRDKLLNLIRLISVFEILYISALSRKIKISSFRFERIMWFKRGSSVATFVVNRPIREWPYKDKLQLASREYWFLKVVLTR